MWSIKGRKVFETHIWYANGLRNKLYNCDRAFDWVNQDIHARFRDRLELHYKVSSKIIDVKIAAQMMEKLPYLELQTNTLFHEKFISISDSNGA